MKLDPNDPLLLSPLLSDDYKRATYQDDPLLHDALKKQNPLEEVVKAIKEAPVLPYLRRRDLNDINGNTLKMAWEVGLRFSF